jgi:hypothetical protein
MSITARKIPGPYKMVHVRELSVGEPPGAVKSGQIQGLEASNPQCIFVFWGGFKVPHG